MSSRELSKILPQQREILNKFMSSYPVKLGKLAKELGIDIKVSSLPIGISGQITRKGNTYEIRVNRNEARERQRFTIGHELSHFLLHRDLIDNSPNGISDTVLYRSGAPERVEYEANRLAAEIVMPTQLVKLELREKFYDVITETTIEELANMFEVSKGAMEIKLSTLTEG